MILFLGSVFKILIAIVLPAKPEIPVIKIFMSNIYYFRLASYTFQSSNPSGLTILVRLSFRSK